MLCRLSESGAVPVEVGQIWITPVAQVEALTTRCTASGAPAYCAQFPVSGFGLINSVKIEVWDEASLAYEMKWFSKTGDPHVTKGGDLRAGFVCLANDGAIHGPDCFAWRRLGEHRVIRARMLQNSKGKSRDERLRAAEAVMDFMLVAFAADSWGRK